MGTPISTSAQRTIETFSLTGQTPSRRDLHNLGIDIKLLEQRHSAIKEHISRLEGFVNLKNIWIEQIRGHKTWDVLVDEAKLARVRAIRLITTENSYARYRPIFLGFLGYDVEVFLTRKGDWIIWYEGYSQGRGQFSRHHTAEAAVGRLKKIPTQFDNDLESIVQLLHEGLGRILDASIKAKEDRLNPLKELRNSFDESEVRNNFK